MLTNNPHKKGGGRMIYPNNSVEAILACERHRLGDYGMDIDEKELDDVCPVCGEENPEYLYMADDECIGCSGCVRRISTDDYEKEKM